MRGGVRTNRVTVAAGGLVIIQSRQAPANIRRRPSFTGTRGAGRSSSCASLRQGRWCGTASVGRKTPALPVLGCRCVHELGVLLGKRHHCSRLGGALEALWRGCRSCTGTPRLRAAGSLQAGGCRLLALVTGAPCRVRRPTRGPRATPLVGTPSLLAGGCWALALVTGAHFRGRRPTRGFRLTASLGWRRPFPLTRCCLAHLVAHTTCA
jgi:hypothetical protein